MSSPFFRKIFRKIKGKIQIGFVFILLALGCTTTSISRTVQSVNPVDAEKTVENLLAQMTLDEKLTMLGGSGLMFSPGVPRLGIPDLKMIDGPLGIGGQAATAFPASVMMSSTWNPELISEMTKALGEEVKLSGHMMLLAPCVNIQRLPQGGRNFESFSEDPFLAATMARAYIQGVQSEGVMATVKHFALNNQEEQRLTLDVHVGERAMHEIYFPAFKAAVDAGTWSVMAAYNKVNGVYASENSLLLNDVLKKDWGFKGFVVSDWGATHMSSTAAAANAGLDDEMPWAFVFSKQHLTNSLAMGEVSMKSIDDKVRRILRAMAHMNYIGKSTPPAQEISEEVLQTHRDVALKVAEEGLVLLKNDTHILPFDSATVHSIAVIGPNAKLTPYAGAGSSFVTSRFVTHGLSSLTERAGPQMKVTYSSGQIINEAVALARQADVVVVFAGYDLKTEGEGIDRKSLHLPGNQDQLISQVAAANPRTVVVLNSGGTTLMAPWLQQTHALIQAWYAGQEGGRAIAAALFGDINPSGRLPESFLRNEKDSWAYGTYPPVTGVVEYREGIYVGYRYLDRYNIEPQFPFGFGLSYTHFRYDQLNLETVPDGSYNVHLTITNDGERDGADVVQVYVGRKESGDFPVRELKNFKKVFLPAGEAQNIELAIPANAFSHYDEKTHAWQNDHGNFEIRVGSSSRDFKWRTPLVR